MKNFIKQRYRLHLAAGAVSVVILKLVAFLSLGAAKLFNEPDLIVSFSSLRWWECGIIGAVLATIAGLVWECYHYFTSNAEFDPYDVLWTTAGGLLTAIFLL